MTWVDLAVLGVLALSGLLAFLRGLVREVLGIGAWVGAGFAAALALPFVRPLGHRWIPAPELVDPICVGVVFLISLIVLLLIARAIGRVVRGSPLGGVDRTLGLVFGLVRGAALVVLAYIFAGMAISVDHWPDSVLEARMLTPTFNAAHWVVERMPEGYKPRLYAPPPGRETTADALLRVTPQGTALGRPAGRQSDRD